MASNKRVDRNLQREYISELPDSLLIEILSLLSLEEAVRASILAQRWSSLWRYVSNLSFDPEKMMTPMEKDVLSALMVSRHQGHGIPNSEIKTEVYPMEQRIDYFLHVHQGSIVNCTIIHLPYCVRYRFLKKWVKTLVEKRIENLRLIGEERSFDTSFTLFPYPKTCLDLPPELLTCTTLQSLEITHYKFRNASVFEGAPNLRILKLEWVYMNDEVLHAVLSNSTLLENLTMSACKGFRNLRVTNPNLKYLHLQGLYVKHMCITTKSLVVLVLDCVRLVRGGNLAINTSNVSIINAYSQTRLRKIFYFTGDVDGRLRSSTILGNIMGLNRSISSHHSLPNLQQLSLDINLNDTKEASDFSCILRFCTTLKKLEILIKEDHAILRLGRRPAISFVWDDLDVCECIKNNLREVKITGFKGAMKECQFFRHLVMEARSLEILSIQCDIHFWGVRETVEMAWHELPKASTNMKMVLS